MPGLCEAPSRMTRTPPRIRLWCENLHVFIFERTGDSSFLSIADSQDSDGVADPEWQRVEFATEEFLSEYDRLQHSFAAALRREAPACAEEWIRAHDGVDPRNPVNGASQSPRD